MGTNPNFLPPLSDRPTDPKIEIRRADGAPIEEGAVYVVVRVDGWGPKRIAARQAMMDYARKTQRESPDESQEIGELIAECQIRAYDKT